MEKHPFVKTLQFLDLSKIITYHIIGKNHTITHRKCTGVVLAIVGVCIAHGFASADIFIIKLFGDVVGYALHGIGIIPFIEQLET